MTPVKARSLARLFWCLEERGGQRLEQGFCERRQVVKDAGVDAAGADCMRRDARSLLREAPLHFERVQHVAQLGACVLGVPGAHTQPWILTLYPKIQKKIENIELQIAHMHFGKYYSALHTCTALIVRIGYWLPHTLLNMSAPASNMEHIDCLHGNGGSEVDP